MTLFLPKPPVTRKQKNVALAVAGIADLVQMALLPSYLAAGTGYGISTVLDVATILILLAVVGARWQMAAVFLLEVIPVLEVFPTWTAFVLTLPVQEDPPVSAHAPNAAPRTTATTIPPIVNNANPKPHDPDIIDVEEVPPPSSRAS